MEDETDAAAAVAKSSPDTAAVSADSSLPVWKGVNAAPAWLPLPPRLARHRVLYYSFHCIK